MGVTCYNRGRGVTHLFLAADEFVPDSTRRLAHQQLPLLGVAALVLWALALRMTARVHGVHVPLGGPIHLRGLAVQAHPTGTAKKKHRFLPDSIFKFSLDKTSSNENLRLGSISQENKFISNFKSKED